MTIIFFILGLIIGSFLNVVVYRLNAVETLMGRSHCPNCKKKVRWHDNIPIISFLILSAKCRDCGEKISWRYPAVELLTAFVFSLIGHYFFVPLEATTWAAALYYLVIFAILLVIFVYDLKYMEIPMVVLWSGVAMAAAYVLYVDWNSFVPALGIMSSQTYSAALGGLVSFAFFFALAWYSKETWMGYGDAYIGLLAGIIVGWPVIFMTLALSFTIGAVVSLGLIAGSKKTLKSQVPFAPFLVTGIFLTIFLPQMFPTLKYFLPFF